MKIPKTLKVGSHLYKIELVKHKDQERGTDNWGKSLMEEKKILIDREMCHSQIIETLIHEIMHICMHEARINYDIYDKIPLTEEQIVMRVSIPLTNILINNNLLR